MKIYFLITLLLASSVCLGEQPTSLPADSADLIAKLRKYEEAERAAVERKISEKQEEVNAALKTHIERETKAGHLERAIALKKLITPATDLESTIWIGNNFNAFHYIKFQAKTCLWVSIRDTGKVNPVLCNWEWEGDELLIYYRQDKNDVSRASILDNEMTLQKIIRLRKFERYSVSK